MHAGRPLGNDGAVSPSVRPSTTFARDARGALQGEHLYTRLSNPNRAALEEALATLEDGAESACFASGSAAANALLETLQPGDRVYYGHDLYYGVRKLLQKKAGHLKLEIEEVDFSSPDATEALQEPAALVLLETPSNPLLDVVDIEAVAGAAHGCGAALVVDNTWATPVLQQPLTMGADFVLHSTTKYVGGHSDVLGGALIARDASTDRWHDVREIQGLAGAVPSPWDCWLLLRSLSTLAVRIDAHCANARALATWLEAHPRIERVRYPGLASHPAHEIARRQMRDFGGMVSVELANRDAAHAFVRRLELFTVATSLGGVHSLAEHRIVVEPPGSKTPEGLVRLSVGIEDEADLRADLEQALSGI